jgi:hypothetical protein
MGSENPKTTAHDPLQPPSAGVGPLMQRDYWAVIDGCRCRPSEIVELVASRFPELPPPDVVVFEREQSDGEPGVLDVGDELNIQIRLAGPARVRVVHTCPCSITLATLKGHPEAGRITFGAYRDDDGRVIFHIRSRARSSSMFNYLGFLAGGDPMQTSTWTDFVNNVAVTCGTGVVGQVYATTRVLEPGELQPADESLDAPTFVAEAD